MMFVETLAVDLELIMLNYLNYKLEIKLILSIEAMLIKVSKMGSVLKLARV